MRLPGPQGSSGVFLHVDGVGPSSVLADSSTALRGGQQVLLLIGGFGGNGRLPFGAAECNRTEGMLTAKGKYGLKALVHMARLKEGTSAQAADLAEANNISKKFLDAILSELRRGGIVQSKRGPTGGYTLTRPARLVTAGEVVRILDGPLAPIACASRMAFKPCRDCKSVQRCEVRRTMSLVRDATAEVLDRLSISDMIHLKDDEGLSEAARRGLRVSRTRRVTAKIVKRSGRLAQRPR